MSRKPQIDLRFECDKCGKPQPRDESQSNQNWEVFRAGEQCECGGTFKMVVGENQTEAKPATLVKATEDTIADLFTGTMIPVNDPFTGPYRVPGWRCNVCGWTVGTRGLPRPHECPEDGEKQQATTPQG
jgi:hypothetical protein